MISWTGFSMHLYESVCKSKKYPYSIGCVGLHGLIASAQFLHGSISIKAIGSSSITPLTQTLSHALSSGWLRSLTCADAIHSTVDVSGGTKSKRVYAQTDTSPGCGL